MSTFTKAKSEKKNNVTDNIYVILAVAKDQEEPKFGRILGEVD